MPIAVRIPPRAAAAVLVLGMLVGGCSGDRSCRGQSYHPDRALDGARTPVGALDTWLDTHAGIAADPPVDGWVVHDAGEGEPNRVVITNDTGDGWWVTAVRTRSGGFVVDEATDDATACGDDLS